MGMKWVVSCARSFDGKGATMPSSAGQSVNIKSKLDATIAAGEYSA